MRGRPSDSALQRLGTHLASEPKVVLAYLHGSVVHSRPGREPSDIDLAVLLDDLADRTTRESFAIDLAIRLERETGLGPFRISMRAGRITAVVVQLEILVGTHWHPVVRYDDVHGVLHRDVLDPAGHQTKSTIPLADRSSFLAFAEQDLVDRWEWYRERFLAKLRRRRKSR